MELVTKTDIGLVREENQDSVEGGIISETSAWTVVCDGMGGANGGKQASSYAVTAVKDFFDNDFDESMEKSKIVDSLAALIQRINESLFEMQKDNPSLKGMGTTIDLVLIKDDFAHIIHVGDSRVYSIRNKKMQQVTTDHSLVQEMVEKGEITPEEANYHPNKNFITRALGITKEVYIDYIELAYEPKDIIISCSDGLTNHVTPVDIICSADDYSGDELAEMLIIKAKENGGSDNITIAVISS